LLALPVERGDRVPYDCCECIELTRHSSHIDGGALVRGVRLIGSHGSHFIGVEQIHSLSASRPLTPLPFEELAGAVLIEGQVIPVIRIGDDAGPLLVCVCANASANTNTNTNTMEDELIGVVGFADAQFGDFDKSTIESSKPIDLPFVVEQIRRNAWRTRTLSNPSHVKAPPSR
jgi:hypothetical protein